MSLFASTVAVVAMFQLAGADAAREEQTRLNNCLELIETNPDAAYEDGLTWSYEGNRPGARYCTALALVALDQADEGAARLEELANAKDAGSVGDRSIYLAQAGNAWLTAGAPDAAITTLTNALKLAPRNGEIHKDRAAAYFMLGDWGNAIADLNQAISAYPSDAEALHMRGRAHLAMKNNMAAMSDVTAAMAADPKNIDVLVLRGEVREAIRKSQLIVLEP